MEKKPLIGVSILAVVLLVLGSLSNVVGYQTVQIPQQIVIKERINQRELLFQTIVDISNNKEIQRIILKYQMSRGVFPPSEIPVIKKNQLKKVYFIGLILSKFIRTSRMQSILGEYELSNQEMQKEISAIIEKDATLNAEITSLQNSECDCENETTAPVAFPLICTCLFLIIIALGIVFEFFAILNGLLYYILQISLLLPLMTLVFLMMVPPFILARYLFHCFDYN